MQHLVKDIYNLQAMTRAMYDAHDKIPETYNADDVVQVDNFYAAQTAYYEHRDALLEEYDRMKLLYKGVNYQFFLKLADPKALYLYEQLFKHMSLIENVARKRAKLGLESSARK